MNERMQHAMASMAAVAERAGHLTPDEQETLAVRLETFAEGLHWEQWFHLPERFLADQITADALEVATNLATAPSVRPHPSRRAQATTIVPARHLPASE